MDNDIVKINFIKLIEELSIIYNINVKEIPKLIKEITMDSSTESEHKQPLTDKTFKMPWSNNFYYNLGLLLKRQNITSIKSVYAINEILLDIIDEELFVDN